jgi:Xaa-Pro dipeptidase
LLATGLRDRRAATGRIGIEETTWWVYSDGLAKELPSATLTSGTPVTAGCRMVKSPAELALMRLASEVTLKAYKAAWQCLREGMTQGVFA